MTNDQSSADEREAAMLDDLREWCAMHGVRHIKEEDMRELLVSLASQPSTLAQDAARYRWLRDISDPGICAFYLSVGMAFTGVKFKREMVDAAIDAARSKLGETP